MEDPQKNGCSVACATVGVIPSEHSFYIMYPASIIVRSYP